MKLPSLIIGLIVGSIIGYFISNEFKRNNHSIITQSSDSTNWHWADSLDAVKAAPHNHKVIFENDKIRILDVILEPHEFEQMHTHRFPSVMFGPTTDTSQFDIIYYRYGYDSMNHKYFAKDSIRQHSGSSSSGTSYAADLMRPEGPHRIKNLSKVRIDVFRVELKTRPSNN